MTSHTGRLYALALAVVVLFLTWAVVAAHPWIRSAPAAVADPRLAALKAREQRLRVEEAAVRKLLRRRWATYNRQLAARRRAIAARTAPAAPSVRVVTLPPLTVTRTS
jgi:hypothetical protein